MLTRTIKICVVAMLLAAVGVACKSTKPRLAKSNDTVRTHVVLDQQFDDR